MTRGYYFAGPNIRCKNYAKRYIFGVTVRDCLGKFWTNWEVKHSCGEVWFHHKVKRIWLFILAKRLLNGWRVAWSRAIIRLFCELGVLHPFR